MMLSDTDIRGKMAMGNLKINGIKPNAIQPASIDLHLHPTLLIETIDHDGIIIPSLKNANYLSVDCTKGYILNPGTFVLGSTKEITKLDSTLTGYVIAKSSLARVGLNVLPGLIDPGFDGTITLEIFSTSQNSILLTADMGICQICVYENKSRARNSYGSPELNSKYQNQHGPTMATENDNEE